MTLHRLDARYRLCPLPVIMTQNEVNHLSVGDRLEVTCTDPGALNDIPTWCRINGHRVLDTQTLDRGEIIVIIEVGDGH